jgi:ribonuclease VapC
VIVDSSAILAVAFGEPTAAGLLRAIAEAPRVGIGAPTLVETGMVLTSRLGPEGRAVLARWSQQVGLEVLAFDALHHGVALDAFRRFGKGRHPAALNFGDCLTYAVAHVAREPLLCVGDDFPRTDATLVATMG